MKFINVIVLAIFLLFLTARGGINREEAIQALNTYMRCYLGEMTPGGFEIGRVKSGFRYAMLTHYYKEQLDEALLDAYLVKVQERPAREKSMITNSGHFNLHWDESSSSLHRVPTEDLSGNQIPDYIDSAAVIFDYVWAMEIDSLGFQTPLARDGQPVAMYDIYFSELKSHGWYGITQPEDEFRIGSELKLTSYIEVDCDFNAGFYTLGLDGLRVTAAHEFNHAIQLCYNNRLDGGGDLFFEDLFFYEMSSTWMEEMLFPNVNDYFQYLPLLFQDVSNSSFTRYQSLNDPYPYANSLYLQMLSRKYTADIVSSIWVQMKTHRAMDALNNVLDEKSSSWLESLSTYGVWLYYTGNRAQAGHYFQDAALYDQLLIQEEDKYTYNLLDKLGKQVGYQANRFLEITNIPSPQLQLAVLGEDADRQGYHLLQRELPSELYSVNQQISFVLALSDTFVLLLTNAQDSPANFSVVQNIFNRQITVYPNPLIVKKQTEKINFINIPVDATVYIYTVNGSMVTQIAPPPNGSILSWNLRNTLGHAVSSGVYLYRIEGEKISETGKFVIVR